MKHQILIICLILAALVGAVSAAEETTGAAQIAVTSIRIDPEVLMRGDIGTITVEITSPIIMPPEAMAAMDAAPNLPTHIMSSSGPDMIKTLLKTMGQESLRTFCRMGPCVQSLSVVVFTLGFSSSLI